MPPLALLELDPDVRLELPKDGHAAGGSARLQITNVSQYLVAFKLKSTAPKNYAIKPSTATIKKGEALEVQVVRRPADEVQGAGGDEEPAPPTSKSKRPDRFLVQAAIVDSDEKKLLLHAASRGKAMGTTKFWEIVPKDMLEERQLEVSLIDSVVGNDNGGSGAHHHEASAVNGLNGAEASPEPVGAKSKKDRSGQKEKAPKEPAKDQGDGKGKGKEAADVKADSKVKDQADGKAAGKGKKGAKDGPPMTDADIDAVISKVSRPGHTGNEPGQGGGKPVPPPGFAPPPGFGAVPQHAGTTPAAADATADSPDQKIPEEASRPQTLTLKKPGHKKHEDVVLQKHQRPVTCVAFSANGKELYTCGKDKLVLAFSAPEGEFLRQYEGHRGAVWACSVTTDGALLLTCGADSMVILWEVASAQKLCEMQLTGVARCVDWSPFGERSSPGNRHFVACSNNFKDRPAALTVWVTRDPSSEPEQLLMIKDLPTAATQVAWAGANGDVICSVHTSVEGEQVLFWNGSTGAQLGRLEAHVGPTSQVSFAHDRSLMASCGRVDMCVRLWDLSTGLSSGEATCLQVYNGDRPLNAVALRRSLSRDDVSRAAAGHLSGACDCLAGGGQDAREVALVGAGTDDQFDPVAMRLGASEAFEAYVAPGSDFRSGGGHFGPIHALSFSSDGGFCVSGSEDGNVRIRDLFIAAGGREAVSAAPSQPAAQSASPSAAPPVPKSKAAQPKAASPKSQPKAQAKAQTVQAPKVELATQIPSQSTRSPPPSSPSSAELANRVIAVYDFDPLVTGWPFGPSQRPLPFARGQEIGIIQDLGGGWAWGAVGGTQGLFPLNYVLPIAKYHEIMKRTMLMAKAGSPQASPTRIPASPPMNPHDALGSLHLDSRSSPAAPSSGPPGLGIGAPRSPGFSNTIANAGLPGGGPPGLGVGAGSLSSSLTGALMASLASASATNPSAPPGFGGPIAGPQGFGGPAAGPLGSLGFGGPAAGPPGLSAGGLSALGGGLSGGLTASLGGGYLAEPPGEPAQAGEEEDGDCSQS